jgi:hypothetical protein
LILSVLELEITQQPNVRAFVNTENGKPIFVTVKDETQVINHTSAADTVYYMTTGELRPKPEPVDNESDDDSDNEENQDSEDEVTANIQSRDLFANNVMFRESVDDTTMYVDLETCMFMNLGIACMHFLVEHSISLKNLSDLSWVL